MPDLHGEHRGRLEPCGCYVGQAGGIARIATIAGEMRRKMPSLLVDVGGIMEGKDALDMLRIETYLRIMDVIGYDAVGIGDKELGFGIPFLKKAMKTVGFPFVSSNLLFRGNPLCRRSTIKDVGGIRIGITGVSDLSSDTMSKIPGLELLDPVDALKAELEKLKGLGASFIIVLSTLTEEKNRRIAREEKGIDLILSLNDDQEGASSLSQDPHPLEAETGSAPICGPGNDGKTVGLGFIRKQRWEGYKRIILGEEVMEDPEVRDRISEFYKAASRDTALGKLIKPLFSSEPLEMDRKNAYIGSEGCRSCHSKEYEQWESTPHAFAFHSLVRKQRQFYPGCVICHSTGYGYPTGFKVGDVEDYLKGVGCESCHGPGKRHAMDPSSTNIRGDVKTRICEECHTSEHSPGFAEIASLLISEVDHKRKPDLQEFLRDKAERQGKVRVELFVMSYCPFGIAAERKLFPILKELGDRIDFSLYFIARERGPKDPPGIEFVSLHGVEEVGEDIRQVVISKLYPDKYMDYILCRGKKGKNESWERCAKKFGIDVRKVRSIVESEEGKRLFRKNIKRTKELNIQSSPTLLIDGRRIGEGLLFGIKGGCGE